MIEVDKLTYSVDEAAKALGVGRRIVYELSRLPDFPAIRLGDRRIVISIDGLRLWVEHQAEKTAVKQ